MSIHAKKQEKWPTWLRAGAFYTPSKAALRHFHPTGEPTQFPMPNPFCSCRTHLQGKNSPTRVTSSAEILTTTIAIKGNVMCKLANKHVKQLYQNVSSWSTPGGCSSANPSGDETSLTIAF